MRTLLTIISLLFLLSSLQGSTLHVGSGQPYATLSQAAAVAVPGDTILIHAGVYSGGIFISQLQGTARAWITILAVPGEEVIFQGGTNAWQFSDAAYLLIRGITVQQQIGNGMNFDDGGSYETPAHHIIWEHCTFRDMNASGNNDLLKMSGVDHFEIRYCLFLNGAGGGSGIDMVGCHHGVIRHNHFENMGSNAIQAKGGTSHIRIEGNYFKNAGQRSLNLGGSTGLAFFRPIDAPFEASDLKVYSNIFIGSMAPVAFVGCINSEVVNNTIWLPERWALRILQETVDETRFPPCGFNTFRNNIVCIDQRVTGVCNIGPNTASETFTFSNNLWFHIDNAGWTGPVLPVEDTDQLVNMDPLLTDPENEDFSIAAQSPAIGAGYPVTSPERDFEDQLFLLPRSVGAIEGGVATGDHIPEIPMSARVRIWPNPANDHIIIDLSGLIELILQVQFYTLDGKLLKSVEVTDAATDQIEVNLSGAWHGHILVFFLFKDRIMVEKFILK